MTKSIMLFIVAMAFLVAVSNELVQYPINDYWTWAALTYPFTFLLCDLCVRSEGVKSARLMVLVGFVLGVSLSLFIDVRIAVASGTAFFIAQMLDVEIFRRLYERTTLWWLAPLLSSLLVAALDTVLFFGIAFYGSGLPWITWSLGDYGAKICIVLISLLPYRLLLPYLSKK